MTLSRTYRDNERACMDGLLQATAVRRRLERAGRADDVALLNIIQFSLLFNSDLTCLLRDLEAGKNSWHAKLHARHLVLTIYECVDDFVALLGKEFRALVARRTSDPAQMKELNEIHSALRSFRDRHYQQFDLIRDSLVAHREHNAQVYIDRLAAMNLKEIEDAGREMVQWLTRLHNYTGVLVRSRPSPQQRTA